MESGTQSEVQRIASELIRRIVAGTYPPGLRLPPEVDLAAELGCSRSTLREALRDLASRGLTQTRRGSGILVLDFRTQATFSLLPVYLATGKFDHPWPVLATELLRMRRMLAVEAARLAAAHATKESIRPAVSKRRDLESLIDSPEEHAIVELELFRDLVVASKIWPAVWLANAFWEPIRAIHKDLAGLINYVPEGHGTMLKRLFTLIDNKDSAAAARLVDTHFENVDRVLIPKIEQLLGPPAPKKRKRH